MAYNAFCRSSPPTLGPTASVRSTLYGPFAQRRVEGGGHGGGRGLGVVGVGALLGRAGPDHELAGAAEGLDLGPVHALVVQRRPDRRRHPPAWLGPDLDQGAAGELDAVVEPRVASEQRCPAEEPRAVTP